MRFILPIAHYTLLESVRNRMIPIVALLVLGSIGVATFLQLVAITEAAQIQSVIIAALLRASAVFVLIAFIVSSIVRESSDKIVELVLSNPLPRWAYVIGKFTGFSMVAAFLALVLSLPLLMFAPASSVFAWCLSLACELVIVAAVSLFCVLALSNVVASLVTVVGFYVLARSISAIQIIAGASAQSQLLFDRAMVKAVDGLSLLLPRLDELTQASWLATSISASSVIGPILIQTLVYVVLILAASLFDFQRQNF